MTDVVNKRTASSSSQINKRQELSSAMTKPGRKPVQTEPKDKRTAQNRAAQRAFRERKERKMKELETKVEELERQKSQLNTESEFLRSQVETLIHELSKFRGETDVLSLLPTSIPKENKKMERTPSGTTPTSSFVGGVTPSSSVLPSSSSSGVYEFPWKFSNSQNPSAGNSPLDLTKAGGQLPSPTSLNQNPGLTAESVKSSSISSESPNSNIEEFLNNRNMNYTNHFDESVDGFCSNLGQACGNKDIPIPKETSSIRNPGVIDSLSNLNSTTDMQTLFSPNSLQNDPLAEFDPTPIDQNLVFGLNGPDTNLDGLFDDFNKYPSDPLASLVTEESIFDPLRTNTMPNTKMDRITTTSLHNLDAKHKIPEANGDIKDNLDDMVVPNKEASLLKCSEIWERITTHPRYSEIDIDGLCMELKHKAKCSERGVVVDDSDVDSLLQKAVLKYPVKAEPETVDFSMFK